MKESGPGAIRGRSFCRAVVSTTFCKQQALIAPWNSRWFGFEVRLFSTEGPGNERKRPQDIASMVETGWIVVRKQSGGHDSRFTLSCKATSIEGGLFDGQPTLEPVRKQPTLETRSATWIVAQFRHER
jgi:hypothetical protein